MGSMRWYAVHTYPQHEKKVSAGLLSRGVAHYLPTYRDVRRYRNRQTVVLERPLFTGYIFVWTDLSDRSRILTPGVAGIVSFGGRPCPLADSDIDLIRRRLAPLNPEPHPAMQAGDRVRVMDGPLAGVEGYLVREKPHARLVITIDLIRRAVSVEVDRLAVEVLGRSAWQQDHRNEEDTRLAGAVPTC